jgi:alkylation response protein AidB-like acyl-CoA dehydrogenase
VILVDDWDGFGQRTTASGTARYERARAEPGNVFPATERFGYQAHFYQTAMHSVLTGITKAALRDGSIALAERVRNYPQGLTAVPSFDPQLLQVIGEVSADVFAAEAALARSTATLDRIVAGRLHGDEAGARRLLIDAEVAVDQAQLVIIAAALSATTKVFDALGASGVSERRGLDRHWKNARTLASHNPRVYKARILGDWLINRIDPVADLASLGRGGQGN